MILGTQIWRSLPGPGPLDPPTPAVRYAHAWRTGSLAVQCFVARTPCVAYRETIPCLLDRRLLLVRRWLSVAYKGEVNVPCGPAVTIHCRRRSCSRLPRATRRPLD
jgi:hypothetical protein